MSNATEFQAALDEARTTEENIRRVVRTMALATFVSQVVEAVPGATSIVMARERGDFRVAGVEHPGGRLTTVALEEAMQDTHGSSRYGFERLFSTFDEVNAIAVPGDGSGWHIAVRPAKAFLRGESSLHESINADAHDEREMWAELNRILGTVYGVELDAAGKVVFWNAYSPCGTQDTEPTSEGQVQEVFDSYPSITRTSMRWMPTEEGGFTFAQYRF
jgi:hypothetical protein